MMYYEQGKDKIGVLNDFDLAAIMDVGDRSPKKQGFERTGTLPYMAIELLDSPDGKLPRWFRHDLESCMWCLVCQSLEKLGKRWYSHDVSDVSVEKKALVLSFTSSYFQAGWRKYYKFIRYWLREFSMRGTDRRDLVDAIVLIEKKREAWLAADRKERNEDYMKPDAEAARDLLTTDGLIKGIEPLEDLTWIYVNVDVVKVSTTEKDGSSNDE